MSNRSDFMDDDIPKPVTIQDVARRAGTALSTASLALNGRARVAESTRRAVLQAAEELGYEASYYAQRLKGRCDNLIGLFSLDLDLGAGTMKLKLIQRLLAARGFDVPIHSYGSFGGGESADPAALISMLRRQKPRAIVCDAEGLNAEAFGELNRFRAEGGVVVCHGYSHAKIQMACDQVIFDTEDNTYQTARHLLELGHRRLAFYEPGTPKKANPRLVGFRRALSEFEAPFRRDWVFYEGLYEAGGAEMARRFLPLLKLPRGERPTAICIVNDSAAASFVHQMLRAKVRVPHDLSVVGHDDWPAAQFCVVPLTTVSHPVEAIAEAVVKLLIDRLEGKEGAPYQEILRGTLVLRDSTAPLPTK